MAIKSRFFLVIALFSVAIAFSGCASGSASSSSASPSSAASRVMKGEITSFEKYGHAVLNIPVDDLLSAGFALGDAVSVEFSNGYALRDIPFYDGYYVKKGDPLLRAYPGQKFAAVCVNYGKINEIGGLSVGDTCLIRLSSKGKFYREQTLNSLVYSDSRSDYESDAVFANFRNVKVGSIGERKLYRSASPIDNSHSRALYADQLAQGANINFVLNLADSRDEITEHSMRDDFRSSYYIRLFDTGRVLPLSLAVDFASADFRGKLAAGLARMVDSGASAPILVHCSEGKDRAGFVSALLEALMGATYDEIVADYMVSYANYYGITKDKDPQKYAVISNNNIDEMIKTIVGVSDAKNLGPEQLKAGAERYLWNGGMSREQIAKLQGMLN